MSFIGKAWRGQERCWIVYWIYGGVIGVAWQILMTLAMKGPPPVMIASAVAYLVYLVWLLVAQWRCAFNLDWKFWGYVVRGMIVLIPLFIVGGVLVGGMLKGQMLMHNAQCKKVMVDATYRSQHPDIYESCLHPQATSSPGGDRMPSAPMRP